MLNAESSWQCGDCMTGKKLSLQILMSYTLASKPGTLSLYKNNLRLNLFWAFVLQYTERTFDVYITRHGLSTLQSFGWKGTRSKPCFILFFLPNGLGRRLQLFRIHDTKPIESNVEFEGYDKFFFFFFFFPQTYDQVLSLLLSNIGANIIPPGTY